MLQEETHDENSNFFDEFDFPFFKGAGGIYIAYSIKLTQ